MRYYRQLSTPYTVGRETNGKTTKNNKQICA